MKEIGYIKWFGGYSSKLDKIINYGIIVTNKDEVFLHKNNINESILTKICKDKVVIFERIKDNKKDRDTAVNIELIDFAIYFSSKNKINTTTILKDLELFKSNIKLKDSYITNMPGEFIANSKRIRNILNPNIVIDKLFTSYLIDNKSKIINAIDKFLSEELEDNIEYKNIYRYSYLKKFTIVYDKRYLTIINKAKTCYNYLDAENKFNFLMDLYQKNRKLSEIDERLNELLKESSIYFNRQYRSEYQTLYKEIDSLYQNLNTMAKAEFLKKCYEENEDSIFIVKKIEEIIKRGQGSFLTYFDDKYELIEKSECIYEELAYRNKINYLNYYYKKSKDIEYVVDKLKEVNEYTLSFELLRELPHEIILNDEVWSRIDNLEKIDKLLAGEYIEKNSLAEIESCYQKLSAFDQEKIEKNLIKTKELRKKYVNLLSPKNKAKMFFNKEIDWYALNDCDKLLIMYRVAKDKCSYNFLFRYEEDIKKNKITYAAYKALKHEPFDEIHDIIQEYVVEKAWDLEQEINLDKILPICTVKSDNSDPDSWYLNRLSYTRYCDCKPWKNVGATYCPWHKIKATEGNIDSNIYDRKALGCAKLTARIEKDWWEWTFKELLYSLNYNPIVKVSGKDNVLGIEYTNKMSGWVNRLNEIRERLRCSHCNQVLKPNVAYAKNLSRFNMTVATCVNENEEGLHDRGIYLNQCWCCKEIIDSREAKIRIGKYYLCLNCGAGPQYSANVQGTICPKCGSNEMSQYKNQFTNSYDKGNKYKCDRCNHIIDIRTR